jgi:nucleotide-binding universal stress UspA family protein
LKTVPLDPAQSAASLLWPHWVTTKPGAFPGESRATMFQHILVPIDGSELSERAAQQSIALAAKLGARITGFVAEPLAPLPSEGRALSAYTRETDAHNARTEAHAQETLARFAAKAAEQGVAFEGVFKRTDEVDHAIVHLAKERACDLIVMVTHGRGMFGELLFGSHTKNVLSLSKLPLLVLH